MILSNEEIKQVVVEIPKGHIHLRTTIVLYDGRELTFQEATIASLVRAFLMVKTHPELTKIRLEGQRLPTRKEGFAEWQLVETDTEAVS